MPPVPHVVQSFETALPSDFDQWPAPVRMVWRELVSSRGWRANAWTRVTFAELGEALGRSRDRPRMYPRATVRRWVSWLVKRGEFERRCVRRGEVLPDGSHAWCRHWIVLPGERMKARAGAATGIPVGIIFDPHGDHAEGAASLDVKRPAHSTKQARCANEGAPRTAPSIVDAAPFKEDSRLSSLSGPESRSETSKLRTKPGGSESMAKRGKLAPPVRHLAERVLRRYAEASGVRVAHFRASSRAMVAACLDEMEGDDAAKEMRLAAVIADAIGESQRRGIAHPPLAYVFNVLHVRRRLERLAEVEHLAQKAADVGGDMFASGFDGAIADARAELAAGLEPRALDRARPFVENRLVTDAARVAAFHKLAEAPRDRPALPLAKTARPAPKRAQDAPQRDSRPLGSPRRQRPSEAVSGPEDALRALAVLFASVPDTPPLSSRIATEASLTDHERAALEHAHAHAHVRWVRAG